MYVCKYCIESNVTVFITFFPLFVIALTNNIAFAHKTMITKKLPHQTAIVIGSIAFTHTYTYQHINIHTYIHINGYTIKFAYHIHTNRNWQKNWNIQCNNANGFTITTKTLYILTKKTWRSKEENKLEED